MDDQEPLTAVAGTSADAVALDKGSVLTIGHVLKAVGGDQDPPIRLEDIRLIRHTFEHNGPDGLQRAEDLTEEQVLDYTRLQGNSSRLFPLHPELYWVVFIADAQRRSRLWGAYVNHGIERQTEDSRRFDLSRNKFLEPLAGRLVVEWAKNTRRWNRSAAKAADLPVLEIADRDKVPFPGFDQVLLSYNELKDMVQSPRYSDWQVALREVQGIYLITDSLNGKQYVGKADGAERILQRWTAYANDGHGGNLALRQLAKESADAGAAPTPHAQHFVFSILRVFGPSTSSSEVDAAESHYKRALMTREFGLNRN